ncbi:MAG TPA: DUF4398 domain-containing protein [Rhodanobacter sp.]
MRTPNPYQPGAPALATVVLLMLGGCASAPMPSTKLAEAEAAVHQASTTDIRENAPGELQVAVGELAGAHQAVTDKDYARADRLAEQAQLDAQIAELHAQSAHSHKAAQESQDAAGALREEIDRNTPSSNPTDQPGTPR